MSTLALQNAEAATSAAAPARTATSVKVGRVLSAIAILFLAFDGAVKFTSGAPVADSMGQLGWSLSAAPVIGIIELVCLVLYVIPRTSPIGVVLLTGYLGGAIATHLRVGNPLFSHILFPTYVAALLWGGLYLRDARVRGLIGRR